MPVSLLTELRRVGGDGTSHDGEDLLPLPLCQRQLARVREVIGGGKGALQSGGQGCRRMAHLHRDGHPGRTQPGLIRQRGEDGALASQEVIALVQDLLKRHHGSAATWERGVGDGAGEGNIVASRIQLASVGEFHLQEGGSGHACCLHT